MTPTEKVKQEMGAFRSALPGMLQEHSCEWVVFHDGKAIGFFENEDSAYRTAVKTLGSRAGFVVAPVVPEEPQPVSFAFMLGVAV